MSPTAGAGPVEAELNSGVMVMVADLTAILPSVYLRLFVDVVFDKNTGEAWFAGTVAQIDPESGAAPNTTDPQLMQLYDDERGWAIAMSGSVADVESGKIYLQTLPQTVSVLVHGIIWVQLDGFRFEATVKTDATEDGRDYGEGLLSADRILLGDESDPDDLGEATAALVITGIFEEEVPAVLPQLCEEDPCFEMNQNGGDCQLIYPWEKVSVCP